MICPVCHQENNDDSKFCSKCGHKIPRCPTCGRVINRRGRFCIYDGTQLPEEILSLFPNDQENAVHTDAMAEIAEEIAAAVVEIADENQTEKSAADAMDVPAEPAAMEPEEPAAVIPEEPAPLTEDTPEEAAFEFPAAPEEPKMKFCIQCGRPCEEGQLLCLSCRRLAQAQAAPVKAVPPDAGLHQTKFCIECGKPCQVGQVLCDDCQAKKAAAPVAVQKKSHVVPVLIGIILVLLLVICAIVGYIAVSGMLNPGRDDDTDDIDTETISERDREDVTVPTEDGDEAATVPSETEPAGTVEPADETEPVITEPTAAETEPTAAETEPVYVHTYELVKADLSWEEAQKACEEKGGYLVTITSQEELDEISELAEASGLTYIWLGASIQSDSDDWGDGSWVTGEAWTFDKWYPGEPSKSDIDGTEEHCLCLWNVKYSGEDLGWTFNDQRNDLVGDLPSLSGKVGYICEYETQVIE